MLRIVLSVLLSVTAAFAAEGDKKDAEKPVFEYRGEPIALPVECGNEAMTLFGLVCPADAPCPVFLELTSADFVKGKVFVAGNLHSEGVTLYTVLLASEDGGLTWTEPAKRVPRSGLDRIYFYDEQHGWAAGHVLEGEPKDPFFLLTTDGGKNWRKREIFTDGRTAEIQRFWFESGRSGGLMIDRLKQPENGSRYERYETMTGAESWMIREVSSQPIRQRRRIARPDSDWRAVPDQKSGAWQVQKRGDAGWISVAEFAVEPGVCVAIPESFAEAPPPSTSPTPGSIRLGSGEAEATAAAAEGDAEKTFDPENQPVAEDGVFVIGQSPPPVNPTQEIKRVPAEGEEDERPTLSKPKPFRP